MRTKLGTLLLIFFTFYGVDSHGKASEPPDELKILDYPELHVIPSASDRLLRVAKRERRNRLSNHAAMLTSSVATLVAAFQATDSAQVPSDRGNVDNNDTSVQVGLAVGGGWLISNLYLMMSYKPYSEGYKSIKGLPSGTQREKLAKERLAEEALYKPAKLGSRLLWFSVITNLGASAYMMGYGDEDAKLAAGVSALVALGPIFFPYDWIGTANQHKSYKKRIYGPIASLTLLRDGSENGPQPGLGLRMSF